MKSTAIIYGEFCGAQKKAVEILTEFILDYTFEYPICLKASDFVDDGTFRCIYIGTKKNNPYISANSNKVLSHPEEYYINVRNDTVMIEGSDDNGVLYGCMDFYNKYIVQYEFVENSGLYCVNIFDDKLPDFELVSHPAVKNRGIWTWGHVIYDFRGFIDNMVKLKMNTIIIWNDCVPVNAKDMIEYAHNCGIKIIWGFAWCWDVDCNVFDEATVNSNVDSIINTFEKEYLPLGVDGIYFQSFTELGKEDINGVLIAKSVTDFVNNTAGHLFEKYPDLQLQFGLHSDSVKNRLEFIRNVDPRIRIVWENCGSFPFSYIPTVNEDHEGTVSFVRDIANLRGENEKFGVVTKGLVKLKWSSFEHVKGAIYLGASSEHMKANRIERKSKIWRYVQSFWLTHADKAYEMVKVMRDETDGNLDITALVEDGMFEKNIMYPVALYSEMLWDCDNTVEELISKVSRRSYITFA